MHDPVNSAGLLLIGETSMSSGSDGPVLQLLGQYAEGAVRVAFHLTRDRDGALDISQEAYVKAMQSLGTLRKGESLRVWFNRIVVNLSRDWLRRKKIEQRGVETLRTRGVATVREPEAELQDREEAEQLREALMQLPLATREAVVLVCVEGFTPQEAAGMLGIPDGTLRSRLHDGREQLRKMWSDDE